MQTPNFSRREVLLWLAENANRVEADSESKCWRAAWQAFSGGVLTEHDGPFFEFERVCRWYGYSPHVDSNGVHRLQYYSFEEEFGTNKTGGV